MAKSTELFSFSIQWYDEPWWRLIARLGPDRYGVNLGKLHLRFEFWFVRGGLKYE